MKERVICVIDFKADNAVNKIGGWYGSQFKKVPAGILETLKSLNQVEVTLLSSTGRVFHALRLSTDVFSIVWTNT